MGIITRRVWGNNQLGTDRAGRPNSEPDGFSTPGPLGRLAYANTAPSAGITNSIAELAFSTRYPIPAKTLQPGMLIKVRFQGVVTASIATETLLTRLRLGGLTGAVLFAITAIDAVNGMIFGGEWEGIVRSFGPAGKIVGVGAQIAVPAASGAAVQDSVSALAETTIDTTVEQAIVATAQWSVANAGNSCRLEFMRVELW